jgi:regulator of protease activity HflC (stomatin/prohibitin superfamily)
LQVEDYLYATSQLAQITLRAILGQVKLDELLSERDRVNKSIQHVPDRTPTRGASR